MCLTGILKNKNYVRTFIEKCFFGETDTQTSEMWHKPTNCLGTTDLIFNSSGGKEGDTDTSKDNRQH